MNYNQNSNIVLVDLSTNQSIDVRQDTVIKILVHYNPSTGYDLFNESYSNSLTFISSSSQPDNTTLVGSPFTKTYIFQAAFPTRDGYFNVTYGRQSDPNTWKILTLKVSIYAYIPVYPRPRPRPEPPRPPHILPHPIPHNTHGRLF